MSAEQELPRVGSVWRNGNEWRIVDRFLSETVVGFCSSVVGPHGSRVRSTDLDPEWRAWAAGAECVDEGEGE